MPTRTRLSQLIQWLEPVAEPHFTAQDIAFLPPEVFPALKEFFPRLLIKEANLEGSLNLLDPEELATSPQGTAALRKLFFNLKALAAAEQERSGQEGRDTKSDTRKVVIHNRLLAPKLRDLYDQQSFRDIFNFCQEKGVFSVEINPQTGLVSTSQGEENWHMSGRQWVTDTVRCQDIEKYLEPKAWRQALFSLLKFYNGAQEIEAMEKSIANPAWYRQGGLTNGVAHIFLPENFQRDRSWFNNKRLESHGLALKALCDTVLAGAVENLAWGFSKEELAEKQEEICQTIANLASYLRAINTNEAGQFDFSAPSAGNWEEIPFPEGLTWDTEAMRSAFQSLHNLLHNPRHSHLESIDKIRLSLKSHAPWLNLGPSCLEEILAMGQAKISQRLFASELPMEHPNRPLDASLAFISTSSLVFSEEPRQDVAQHLKLLAILEEHLVLSHGIIRYAPFTLTFKDGSRHEVFDSYLADNYWLLPPVRSLLTGAQSHHSDYGSSDCSDDEAYLARVKLARPGTEAQWCFVSVLADGYICQLEKLLRFGEREENKELIQHSYRKAGEFLNRSFARITGEHKVKANGQNCPAFAIPEAYETVSAGLSPDVSYLPGVNTPLAWGQASLFNACRKFALLLEETPELPGLK